MTDNQTYISEKLKIFFDERNITQQEIAVKMGVSQPAVSALLNGKPFGKKLAQKWGDEFGIKPIWLLTGEGEMLKATTSVTAEESETVISGRLIPFYDAEAAAGISYGINMDVARPVGLLEIGGLLKDSESALRVYGNSMTPNYPAGCVVGLRSHLDSFIVPGSVYVVETLDNRYIKRLYYNKAKTAFRCVSDNHMTHDSGTMQGEYYYPDFEIPFNEVSRLFRVVGVIKRNQL